MHFALYGDSKTSPLIGTILFVIVRPVDLLLLDFIQFSGVAIMSIRLSVGLSHSLPKLQPLHTRCFSNLPHPSTSTSSSSLRSLTLCRPSQQSTPTRSPTTYHSFESFSVLLLTRRTFSSSSPKSIRSSYFPQPSRGGPTPNNQSWWRQFRRRIDNLPPSYILWGIIGLNVGIFGLWQYAQQAPALKRFL